MPTPTAWKTYVGKVVRRYKGRGVDYQIWNEANVKGFWSGTTAQMADADQDGRARSFGATTRLRRSWRRRWPPG